MMILQSAKRIEMILPLLYLRLGIDQLPVDEVVEPLFHVCIMDEPSIHTRYSFAWIYTPTPVLDVCINPEKFNG